MKMLKYPPFSCHLSFYPYSLRFSHYSYNHGNPAGGELRKLLLIFIDSGKSSPHP